MKASGKTYTNMTAVWEGWWRKGNKVLKESEESEKRTVWGSQQAQTGLTGL